MAMNRAFMERSIAVGGPSSQRTDGTRTVRTRRERTTRRTARDLFAWARENWTSVREKFRTTDGYYTESVITFRDGATMLVAGAYVEDQIDIYLGEDPDLCARGDWVSLHPVGGGGEEYFALMDELQTGRKR